MTTYQPLPPEPQVPEEPDGDDRILGPPPEDEEEDDERPSAD
jgi:hypothetical protein